MNQSTPSILPIGIWVAAGFLITIQVFIHLKSALLFSPVYDEPVHIGAGYDYLLSGSLRFNREHPPLAKLLSALPLRMVDLRYEPDNSAWTGEPINQWRWGRQFLFANDADTVLLLSRLPMIALAVLLGIYVLLWGCSLFGPQGGLLSLILYTFCPTMLGHGHFVTFDVPLAFFCFACLFHVRRAVLLKMSLDIIAAGLFAGCALATKFSGVLLLPVLGAILIHSLANNRSRKQLCIGAAIVMVLAVVVVEAVYRFPLNPTFYLQELQRVYANRNPGYAYYMLGRFQPEGLELLLIATILKTPLLTLGLILLSLAIILFQRTLSTLDVLLLLILPLLFLVATSLWAHNIGIRYLAPMFPFMHVLVGKLATLVKKAGKQRGLLAGVFLILAVESASVFPDYLGYFNQICGNSESWRCLGNSNLDWGQDLKRLKSYLADSGIARITLSYSGQGKPEYYGIAYDTLPKDRLVRNPPPGIYAVSIQNLLAARMKSVQDPSTADWLELYAPTARIGRSFYIYSFPS